MRVPYSCLVEVFAAFRVRALERTLSDPTLSIDHRATLTYRLTQAREAFCHARRVNDKAAFGAA